MTVNHLARRAGIPAHVVRYYTRRGLLSPARNLRNAYRQYGESDLRRLLFICRVKTMGFTLSEIGMLLKAADDEASSFPAILELMRCRAQQYRRELTSAQRLQRTIMEVIEHWNGPDGSVPERVTLQRLIEAIAHEGDALEVGARRN